ncbi:MAG: putative maltokinase, partial [Gemmatimonadota bacterium]
LARHKGRVPIELMGRTTFPPIGELPYLLTLPGHGFYWFRLDTDVPAPQWHIERLAPQELPVLVLFDGFNSLFRERVVPWRIGMADKTREQFETAILPPFLRQQRWFATKGEQIERARIVDDATFDDGRNAWLLTLNEVLGPQETVRYFMPLGLVWEEKEEERLRALAPAQLAKARQQAQVGGLVDAVGDEPFCAAVVRAIGRRRDFSAHAGAIHFRPTAAFGDIVGTLPDKPLSVQVLAMSSNSVALLGDRLFLKIYRRVREGVNPELEIGRFLTDVAKFDHCVPVAGSVDYVAKDGQVTTLALLQRFTPNQGDGWEFTVEYLGRHLEAGAANPTPQAIEAHGAYLTLVRRLGERTAQLHGAFALTTGDAAFDPEPLAAEDVQVWAQQVRSDADLTLRMLVERAGTLPPALQVQARRLLEAAPRLTQYIERLAQSPAVGKKTRIHGDYHLGQVLIALNDFVIIDFEGEPTRPLAERRRKQSALRDVAGMLRSFNYARHAALLHVGHSPEQAERLAPHARSWEEEVRAAFLQSYRDAAAGAGVFANVEQFDAARGLLDLFELEKALYELRYELQSRPDWVAVPLAGIAALAALPIDA